ncbi:unnamed protein product, partial [Notodromas monacha]
YGLLGPSGCGKTTLLSCIVGRLRLDAGEIRVFGQKPGHKDSGVPGSLVGYMPQCLPVNRCSDEAGYHRLPTGSNSSTIEKRPAAMLGVLCKGECGFKGFVHWHSSKGCSIIGGRGRGKHVFEGEIALYQQFSIEETLRYFGRLHGMRMDEIKRRTAFLIRFLGLPNTSRMVENLSGGQQRRVSLACALLQKPKLLILDEPTVGVDPLLRYSIWCHLVTLARDEGTSVVITTHYIEEARQANRVGLMRNGCLLAEASPESLLIAHRLTSLEDVFLKLCQSVENLPKNGVATESGSSSGISQDGGSSAQQGHYYAVSSKVRDVGGGGGGNGGGGRNAGYENPGFASESTMNPHGKRGRPTRDQVDTLTLNEIVASKTQGLFQDGHDPFPVTTRSRRGRSWVPTLTTMRALLIKNFISMFRHKGALTFEILLPPFQIILFCLTLSADPQSLGLAVFNEEAFNITSPTQASCDDFSFSCGLIDRYRSDILKPRYYESMEAATKAVLEGEAWGTLHVRKNFSSAFLERVYNVTDASEQLIRDSTIDVRLDMTNQQIVFVITRELLTKFGDFFKQMMSDYGFDPNLASLPLEFGEPIYGVKNPKYTEFVAPGMLVMIVFFMAMGLTAMAFVLERKQGLIYRSYVSGVKNVEVLVCYMITQACVVTIQIVLTLLVMLVAFKLPNRGSVAVMSLLCFMQGVCGMSFGLLVSCLVNDETSAIVACMGVFMPSLLLSGMCWPREGMDPILRMISLPLPHTFGTDALRSVMSRGLGLSDFTVLMGVVVPGAWTIVQMGLSGISVHLKEGF